MNGQKIKDTVSKLSSAMGDVLHPKIFVLSFSGLMLATLLLVGAVVIMGDNSGHSSSAPTGKVMASIKTEPVQKPAQKEEELPPPPEPEVHTTADENINAQPLEATDKPTDKTIDVEDAIAGLSESSSYGPLPIIRSTDKVTVFDAYKAPFVLNADTKAVISLVVVDYGLSDKTSKDALLKLPAATSFVASPYSTNLQAKITAARAHGMEAWLNMPIQGADFVKNDTGPMSILSTINSKQNIARLNTNMGHATGYVGLVFANSPDFPAESPELASVMTEISKRGLGLAQLDTSDNITKISSEQNKIQFVQNEFWIDTSLNKDAILAKLADITTASLDKASVVIAFHPYPVVIDAIAEWQSTLADKKIQLAPLTTAIHQKVLLTK